MKTLLFTDLDGTLIDHHTYSASVAKTALLALTEKGIPVIFCSSKTFAEQLDLQKKLGLHHPFIVENGSAIAIPKGYFPFALEEAVQVSKSHDMVALAQKNTTDIRLALEKINKAHGLDLFGYARSSAKTIAQITGLKGKAVLHAKNRWFTESLFSEPPSLEALQSLDLLGLSAVQGGRFLTVQDKTVDKGKAVLFASNLFQAFFGEKPFTVGIGDSPNDAAFLQVVDRPFLVQKHDGKWADVPVPGLIKIPAIGPKGFLEMASQLQ